MTAYCFFTSLNTSDKNVVKSFNDVHVCLLRYTYAMSKLNGEGGIFFGAIDKEVTSPEFAKNI